MEFDEDPLTTFFAPEEKSRLSLPYIEKLSVQHEATAKLPSLEKLMKEYPQQDHNLSPFTQMENAKVNFYLTVLSKGSEDAEKQRIQDREKEKLQDLIRQQQLEKLYDRSKDDKNTTSTQVNKSDKNSKNKEDLQALLNNSTKNESPAGDQQQEIAGGTESDDDYEENTKEYHHFHHSTHKKKFVRSTAQELEYRLQQLRKDPTKRAELEDRIARFKAKRMNHSQDKNILDDNKKVAREFTPSSKKKRIAEQTRLLEGKIKQVKAHKKQLDEVNLQHKLRILHRREIKEHERQQQKLFEARQAELQNRQKKWMLIVSLASRHALWLRRVQEEQIVRKQYKLETSASITIQTAWRGALRRRAARKWRHCMIIVYRVLRRWVSRFRVHRRHKAADIIYNFLTDLQDVNRIVQVVKRFRYQVTQAQIFWRKFKEVQNAQLNLLRRQWDLIEDEMTQSLKNKIEQEQKKEDIMKNALNYTSSGAKRRKAILAAAPSRANITRSGRSREKPKKQVQIPKVPEHIKTRILVENLRQRQREYSIKLSAYKRAVAKYQAQAKNKEAIELARKQMMESAIQLDIEQPRPSTSPGQQLGNTIDRMLFSMSMGGKSRDPTPSSTRPSTVSGTRAKSPTPSNQPKKPGSRPSTRQSQERPPPPLPQLFPLKKLGKKKGKKEPELSIPVYPGAMRVLLPKHEMTKLIEEATAEMAQDMLPTIEEKPSESDEGEEEEEPTSDDDDDVLSQSSDDSMTDFESNVLISARLPAVNGQD